MQKTEMIIFVGTTTPVPYILFTNLYETLHFLMSHGVESIYHKVSSDCNHICNECVQFGNTTCAGMPIDVH